ncbi:hypothetical protein BU24DRAFT_468514 [Aaosphaeria arxii CBS 175.79]|uniref:Restriction endonuclease type IV Mrr domain-containing protein n=1 Tax=Aaosphaeria arxii CBS 175.79 TaxID=1450172 RepID=A0A6A5X852_9PLEO|nr:uncharacterized protein BU24DRAFT_468514 [Aaosphaeria arxii CBS 175.79]KAF2009128.1 hypothetical protein BU24DRAFT_468514 [Aaosphaeria arxii CBS 175.79]
MKYLIKLVLVAVLLISGVSSSPLDEYGIIEARTKKVDYNIDGAIVAWSKKKHTKDIFKAACDTTGGWESWVQVELELVFRKEFDIPRNINIREQSKVYHNGQIADFLLPETAKFRGMVIELKCENNNSNKEEKLKDKVDKDLKKEFSVDSSYLEHKFVVLAMTYTREAEDVVKKLDLEAIPKINYKIPGKGTMRVFRKDLKPAELTEDVNDVADALSKLFLQTNKRL